MSLACNPLAVAWKKNNAPGIRCAEQSDGTMWLVAWPEALGPIPSQSDLDQWGTEYAQAVAVPASVTPLQARKALTAAGGGLREAVEAWVDGQSQAVQDAWRYANEVRRDDATLVGAADALQLTSEQLDDLFIAAAGL